MLSSGAADAVLAEQATEFSETSKVTRDRNLNLQQPVSTLPFRPLRCIAVNLIDSRPSRFPSSALLPFFFLGSRIKTSRKKDALLGVSENRGP